MNIFNLPDLGEGLAEAEIVAWYVKPGDTLKVDQPLVSMETAKAIVEVPSPVNATVVKFFGEAGDIIKTGSPLVEFKGEMVSNIGRHANTVAGKLEEGDVILTGSAVDKPTKKIKATPAVRALARKMDVDLTQVIPTGPMDSITMEDVIQANAAPHSASSWEPLKGVRRTMSQLMTCSHKTVVPVTVVEDVVLPEAFDPKNVTISVIQAMCVGVQAEPNLNAWYDNDKMARCLRSTVDLGIAMDLPNGLFVPVIKNAEIQTPEQLRLKINTLKEALNTHTIAPKDLQNPSIVLSNYGKFAGRFATPIVVPPTVAILGVGRLRMEPIVRSGQCLVGRVLPLALSVDHRAITGGEATRFLRAVMNELTKVL